MDVLVARRRLWSNLALAVIVPFCVTVSAAPKSQTIVGTTDAKFAVTADGAATYSIPIKVPPGTNGVEPKLALAYNSRAGKTPYGFGWNISGLTLIQRGQQNLAEDGVVRGVALDSDDALMLDGEKLVAVADTRTKGQKTGGAGFVEYRTRVDSFTRVRAYDWSATGPGRLTAETRPGLTIHFGRSANSRVAGRNGTGPVIMWLCDRIEDKAGNYMSLTYLADTATMDYQIKEIAYTGNDTAKLAPYAKVVFDYETLGAPYEIRFLDGEPLRATKRLKSIAAWYGGQLLRRYLPEYETGTVGGQNNFYLKSLTESGVGNAESTTPGTEVRFRPLKFSYTHAMPLWAQRPWVLDELATLPEPGKVSQGFHVLKVSKDGSSYTGILFRGSMAGKDATGAYFFDSATNKWAPLAGKNGKTYVPPVPLATQSGAVSSIAWADINGDGFEDLLVSGFSAADDGTYLNRDGGWEKVAPIPIPISGGSLSASGVALLDIAVSGAPVRTLVWNHRVSSTGAVRSGAIFLDGNSWKNSPHVPPMPMRGDASAVNVDRTYAIDVDCDGAAELVYLHPQASGGQAVFKATTVGWSKLPSSAIPNVGRLPAHSALQVIGKTASNCTRIMSAFRAGGATVRSSFVGEAGGWQPDVAPPDVFFWTQGAGSGSQVASLADLNSDGQADIIAHAANGAQRYAYLNNGSAGWTPSNGYAVPLPLSPSPLARDQLFQVFTLAGTTKTLLMYLGTGPNPAPPRIFARGAGGGWEEVGDYRLPGTLNIAAFDKIDLGVRFVDVNGDGYPDIVWSVRKGAALESKAWLFNPKSTQKKWEERPEFALPEATTTDDYRDTGVLLVDVNGDGLVDILVSRETSKFVRMGEPPKWEVDSAVYINCSKKNTSPCVAGKGVWQKNAIPGLAPPAAFVRDGLGSLGVRAIDVNGDGLTDLVYSKLTAREPTTKGARSQRPAGAASAGDGETPPEEPSPYEMTSATYLNDGGQRWVQAPKYALSQPIVRQVHCPAQPGGVQQSQTGLCQFFQDDEVFQGQQTIDTRLEFIDLNADRLPDVVYHYRSFVQVPKNGVWEVREQIVAGALINTGDGWRTEPAYAPPDRIDPQAVSQWEPNGMQVYFNDLNADGLPDLIYVRKGASKVLLNTNAGWSAANAWFALPDDAIGPGRGDPGLRLFDVDGDGLLDIVFSRTGGASPGSGTYINTGTGWVPGAAALKPPMAFAEDGLADVGVRPLDVNGDGLIDLIQFFARSGGGGDRAVFVNESGRAGLLESVTDGMGLTTSVAYESYLAYEARSALPIESPRAETTTACGEQVGTAPPAQAACDSAYPVIHALLPGYVVTRAGTSGPGVERRSMTYRYAGYRLDVRAAKSLGFAFQETFDEQRFRLTRNEFVQLDGLIGSLQSSVTLQRHVGVMREIAKSVSSWSTTSQPAIANPHASPGFAATYLRPYLTRRSSLARDLLGKVVSDQTDEYEYDKDGNLRRLSTSFPDGSGAITTSEYKDENVARWLLGRPTRSEISQFAVSKQAVKKRTDFTYDTTTGWLISETSFPGTPFERAATFKLDVFGNKTSSTVSSSATGASRTQRSDYDAQGRFIRTAYNAMGHATKIEYDEASGVVRRRIDPNGVTNELFYDALQQPRKEISGTGVVTWLRTDFVRPSESNQYAYVQAKKVGALPETLTFSDALGRVRRKVSLVTSSAGPCPELAAYIQPVANAEPVITDIRFDEVGRSVSTTVPRLCSTHVTLSRRIRYDDLDRVVASVAPDGATSRTTFTGLSSTFFNANGKRTITTKDIRGRVVLAEDALGGTTRFEYDAAGRTVATVDAIGQRTEMTYDLIGNKTTVEDGIAGRWQFASTAFGDLAEQRDPRGNVIKLEYDALGRMVKREIGSRVSRWVYDQCPNGLGRLCSSETPGVDSSAISYDKTGRVARNSFSVGLDSLQVTFDYDAQDRVVAKRYSTGVTVQNEFDALGVFRAVQLVDGQKVIPLARATGVDEMGRVRREEYANGMVRAVEIAQDSGRVTSISTSMPSGADFQRLQLEYDKVGNVTSRKDTSAGVDEAFVYDALNRLTNASGAQQAAVAVSYDAIGNITEKSGVGQYTYCSQNGLRNVLCSVGTGTTAERVSYDSAGNITALGERTLRFDADGRVQSIERLAGAIRVDYSDFTYGTDGQVATQETRRDFTKYRSTYIADAEVVREEFASPFFPTPERTKIRHYVVGPSGVVGFYEKVLSHFPFRFASPFYGGLFRAGPERVTSLASFFRYFVKDQIGSLVAVVGDGGDLIERFTFDAWGSRSKSAPGYKYRAVRTGFTGHEHIDSFDLVHMQGRVYSSVLGRFLSPDVIVQFPLNTQSFSRYSYAFNNPLRYIDPSGFDLWGDIGDFFGGIADGVRDVFDAVIGKPIRWAGEQLQKAGQWLEKNWRIVVIVAVAIAAPYALPAMSAIAAGAITGAAVGALSAALYGGNIDDVLRGAAMGAITGAITGGVAQAYGESYSVGRVFSEGVAGGVTSHIRGGNFSEGFNFAFAMAAVTYANQEMRRDQIEGSRQIGPGDENNLAPQGQYSEGKFGLKDKIGGARKGYMDEGMPLDCSGGTFGGCQAGRGEVFGVPYDKGSFKDNLVESFAGPHDWLIDKTGGYWSNGFGKRFGNVWGDQVYPGVMLVPAAYFAAPAFVPVQARDEMRRRCSNAYGWCM